MPTLNWLNRNKTLVTTPKVPRRILWADEGMSCGGVESGNMLIRDDNLHAKQDVQGRDVAAQVRALLG